MSGMQKKSATDSKIVSDPKVKNGTEKPPAL
jgi:hypothetical protein